MSTLTLTLPRDLDEWVRARARDGAFADASDYVRDLIAREVERATLQREVDEALASGPGTRSIDDLWREAVARAART